MLAAAAAAGVDVVAHTSDDNTASRATLAKFGFVRQNATNDDGEHLYVRPPV
jgi:RimJ/RimL family protein N-acetyltransferase